MNDADALAMKQMIFALEREVRDLRGLMQPLTAGVSRASSPRKPVFLARTSGTGMKTFVEVTINGSAAVVEVAPARAGTTGTDTEVLQIKDVTDGADCVVLLEVPSTDSGGKMIRRYVEIAGCRAVIVRIKAWDAGKAMYLGEIDGIVQGAEPGVDYDIQPTVIGIHGTACWVANTEEGVVTNGSPQVHELMLGSYAVGILFPAAGEGEDRRPLVYISGGTGAQDTSTVEVPDPNLTTLGPEDIGTSTAMTDTWNRGQGPLKINRMWRQVWDNTDKKIYGFIRTENYDSRGQMYSVSGETRVEIVSAGPCPT